MEKVRAQGYPLVSKVIESLLDGGSPMILGIDPKVDYAFKHFLGREETRPILIDVIERAIYPDPGGQLLDVELLNPFNPKEALDDKLSILDIKARDQSGRQFNVEMQLFAQPVYRKRVFYYAAKLHQQQLHEGEGYESLRPTISISFVNSVLYSEIPDWHLRFRLLEQKHLVELTRDIEFHMFELPKFTKTLDQLDGGSIDIWLYFLRHAEKMDTDAVPAIMQQPMVLRALEDLKMLTQSDIERERYESRLKAQRDHDSGLREARKIGEKIGMIHSYEQILQKPETASEDLEKMSMEELSRIADELRAQVLAR